MILNYVYGIGLMLTCIGLVVGAIVVQARTPKQPPPDRSGRTGVAGLGPGVSSRDD